MRRTSRLILNFVIGFLLLVVCSLGFLLVSHAPMHLNGSIARVQIGQDSSAVYIPGYEFSCTRGSQLDRYEVMFASRPLEIAIAYADPGSKRNAIRCQAFYAGLTSNCTTDYDSIIIGGWLPLVTIQSNLGLSNLQLQQLQMQALEKKNIVLQLPEDDLVLFVIGIAIVIGLVAAASGWLYFGKFTKVVASICLGFVMYRVCWSWLGRVPFDVMLYGLDAKTWSQCVNWIAIAAGIITCIATTRLLWSQRNQLAKAFVCISSGYGAFTLSWVSFLYSLLALGFAD